MPSSILLLLLWLKLKLMMLLAIGVVVIGQVLVKNAGSCGRSGGGGRIIVMSMGCIRIGRDRKGSMIGTLLWK